VLYSCGTLHVLLLSPVLQLMEQKLPAAVLAQLAGQAPFLFVAVGMPAHTAQTDTSAVRVESTAAAGMITLQLQVTSRTGARCAHSGQSSFSAACAPQCCFYDRSAATSMQSST
jgi:hypothetical protein